MDDGEDSRAFSALLHEMKNLDIKSDNLSFQEADKEAQLVINGVGHWMVEMLSCELESVISIVNNTLFLYRDPIVGENTKIL